MPPVIHYTTTYAPVAGARWRGHNVDSREVFWPIQIFCDTNSKDWVLRDRAFWKTLRPEKVGIWTVIQPSGEERYLDCRFVDDGQQAFNIDPALMGWTNYGITLRADQPFWRGQIIRETWSAGTTSQFFGSTGLRISPASTIANARMTNPGDADAYPVWEIIGPVSAGQVGIQGRNIGIPFTVEAGKILIIDTDPSEQSATLYSYTGDPDDPENRVLTSAQDKTMDLAVSPDFAPMPADQESQISLGMTGAGHINLVITPLYLRAW